jgi:hypothetical protein
MSKRIVWLWIVVLIASSAVRSADPRTAALDGVPGLDKPITLSLRAASLGEVLDIVEAKTGVKLRPERSIEQDKATILVKDRPARDVLREIARCFNLCWVESEIGSSRFLRLATDRNYDSALMQRQYDDFAAVVGQLDQQLGVTAQYVRTGQPYEPPPDQSGMSRDERFRLDLREMATVYEPMGALILQYVNLSEQQKKELAQGKDVEIPASSIAGEVKQKYPEVTSFRFWVERSLAGYLLEGTVQPLMPPSAWQLITTALFDDSRYEKTIKAANEALSKDSTLDKELPAPKPDQVAPPESLVATAPSGPLAVPLARPGEGSASTPATISDGLLEIAEAAQVPFVAQYISEYAGAETTAAERGSIVLRKSAAKTLRDRLAELSMQHKFTVERDGDFLLAKSLLWHRLRGREVPEATIKRWQKEITGLTTPTFDVLVEMASTTWEQVRGIISNGLYWFGIPYPLSTIAAYEHQLKLYNSLTADQRRILWEGSPIPIGALRPEQQHVFMQAYESRTRPTYGHAQDPNWPQRATFSARPEGLGGYTLFAVAGMRCLGVTEVVEQIAVPSFEPETSEQAIREYMKARERLRAEAEAQLADKARQFVQSVAADHPEIPSKNIAVYCVRRLMFEMRIGEELNGSVLSYSTRLL